MSNSLVDPPRIVIGIPFYRQPDEYELFSLARCSEVLSHYPIVLVGPRNLSAAPLLDVCPRAELVALDERWFATMKDYNHLMVTSQLYELFSDFDYLLIHQLDCFVFQDGLLDWARRGYDYVGPPWYRAWYRGSPRRGPAKAGIGGFSLRRISSFVDVLREVEAQPSRSTGWRGVLAWAQLEYGRAYYSALFRGILRRSRSIADAFGDVVTFRRGEDEFWALDAPSAFRWFTVPNAHESLRFAFNFFPLDSFARIGGELPLGVHSGPHVRAIAALMRHIEWDEPMDPWFGSRDDWRTILTNSGFTKA